MRAEDFVSLSSRHDQAGNEATLVDLQSKNGTRVAGREVLQATPLFDGAVIQIGRVEVVYRCPAAREETETARHK